MKKNNVQNDVEANGCGGVCRVKIIITKTVKNNVLKIRTALDSNTKLLCKVTERFVLGTELGRRSVENDLFQLYKTPIF